MKKKKEKVQMSGKEERGRRTGGRRLVDHRNKEVSVRKDNWAARTKEEEERKTEKETQNSRNVKSKKEERRRKQSEEPRKGKEITQEEVPGGVD